MASAHYRNRIAAFYPQDTMSVRCSDESVSATQSALRRATVQLGKMCGRSSEFRDNDPVGGERGKLIVVATVLLSAGVATIVGALPTLIGTGGALLTALVGWSPGIAMTVAASGFLMIGVGVVTAAVVRISRALEERQQAVDDLRWRILFLEESVRRLERGRPSNH